MDSGLVSRCEKVLGRDKMSKHDAAKVWSLVNGDIGSTTAARVQGFQRMLQEKFDQGTALKVIMVFTSPSVNIVTGKVARDSTLEVGRQVCPQGNSWVTCKYHATIVLDQAWRLDAAGGWKEVKVPHQEATLKCTTSSCTAKNVHRINVDTAKLFLSRYSKAVHHFVPEFYSGLELFHFVATEGDEYSAAGSPPQGPRPPLTSSPDVGPSPFGLAARRASQDRSSQAAAAAGTLMDAVRRASQDARRASQDHAAAEPPAAQITMQQAQDFAASAV